MNNSSYSEKLRDPRWQKKRLQILERDGFACRFCGDQETTLHIHHKKYHGEPWEVDDDSLVTACKHCHAIAEYLKDSRIDWFAVLKIPYSNLNQTFAVLLARGKERVILFLHYDGKTEELSTKYILEIGIVKHLTSWMDDNKSLFE